MAGLFKVFNSDFDLCYNEREQVWRMTTFGEEEIDEKVDWPEGLSKMARWIKNCKKQMKLNKNFIFIFCLILIISLIFLGVGRKASHAKSEYCVEGIQLFNKDMFCWQ